MLGQRPHVLSNVAPHAAMVKGYGRRATPFASCCGATRRAHSWPCAPFSLRGDRTPSATRSPYLRRRFCRKSRGRCGSATAETDTEKDHPLYDPTVSTAVGLVERPLYVAAFLAGAPALVGVWLGLKVAGGWKGWQDAYTLKSGKMVAGRTVFNFMLIGSAVSVAYGWVGARIIRALQTHDVQSAVVVAVGLFLATLDFYLLVK